MSAIVDEDEEIIASINMVPFIDISLVLLIIFLVTSAYIVRQAIEVELPQAATASEATPTTVSLEVRLDGSLWLNGAAIQLDNLEPQLRALREEDPEVRAMIAGDRGVAYGEIMNVVDRVKRSGFGAFALNVERIPVTDP